MPILRLQPIDRSISARTGTRLRELLFELGVEFPCGGNGRCRGCRVRVTDGALPLNDAQRELLTESEIAAGWRLACQSRLEADLTLEMRQWEAAILTDESAFKFEPRPGYGVAVDVGTTTLVGQLLDLSSGNVLAVKSALNPQAQHGSDVMSRVHYAIAKGGALELTGLIREAVRRLIIALVHSAEVDSDGLADVVMVGNTVMHHLFGGIDVAPMAAYPFEPKATGVLEFNGRALGWRGLDSARIRFLPCLGGFVGSDILAGIVATGIHLRDELSALIDLGTNGEIVVGNREDLLCAGTAAGPAFEGARIAAGMRASTGAIWKVTATGGHFDCEVLGNVEARGICGSGIVDAVSVGLERQLLLPTGRIATGGSFSLTGAVALNQTDVRQVQLAKAAIAAGLDILRRRLGVTRSDISRVYLAGAFGNYIDRASARRIGLLDFPLNLIEPAGNTALLGAKMILSLGGSELNGLDEIRHRVRHIPLHADSEFQELFVEALRFPSANST